ncbi:MAG TPA: YaiI/YqxD family protein [Gemmataceae bacterium]|nr:YaiI/YqxD family protein [Gemmataceae bacterium]
MLTIYIDADACPVKEEVYKVARRYEIRVGVVSRTSIRIPSNALFELIECPGFGAVDEWIAEKAGEGDIVITADIPLAARCLAKEARVIDPRGNPFSESDIGAALAMRELMADLRQDGTITGGPPPITPKDRSRFLSRLDEAVIAVRRSVS